MSKKNRTELVLIPGLPHVPGWVALSQPEKEWLQEHTSNAKHHYSQSGMTALQACAEVAMIERFLEEHKMNKDRYFDEVFGGHKRTIWRLLKNYKQMKEVKGVTDEFILYLAQEGIAGMQGAHTGEIVTAFKQLPNLVRSNDPKEFSEAKDKLAERLRANRSARSKKRERPLDEDEATKDAVPHLYNLMKRAQLKTTKQQGAWLSRTFGYVMNKCGIPGPLTVKRTAPPEGFLPQIGAGRPRLTTRKAKKAATLLGFIGVSGLGIWWFFFHHVTSTMALGN